MSGQLPYDLYFTHRFNIHKLAGLLIDDYDLESIARMYGVPASELKEVQDKIDGEVAEGVAELKKKYPAFKKPFKRLASAIPSPATGRAGPRF